MNKPTIPFLAVAILAGGCASVESTPRYWESPLPQESFVLGSKLPRTENFENYQGTKSLSRPDYQQYKGPRYGEM
jgi:hypothetical protein